MTRRSGRSLQYQLSLWISVFIGITALAAAILSFASAFREAHELQDDQLRQVADLMSHNQLAPTAVPYAPIDDSDPEARLIVAQLGVPTPSDDSGLGTLPRDLPEGFQTVARKGGDWRLFVRTLASGKRIAVAQPTAVREETARDSGLRTLLPLLVLLPVLVMVVAFVIRRTLLPVRRLSQQLDGAGETHGDVLIDETVPDEIQPFVSATNRALGRLSTTIVQQRRFVADAAHELRSPIAALTLQAENLERSLPDADAERMAALKRGLSRVKSLLEQLLSLARHQSVLAEKGESVRLDEEVKTIVEDLLPLAIARNIDLGFKRFEAVSLCMTRVDLGILFRNALNNAIRFTPQDGAIDVSVFEHAGQAILVVEDCGPGIPEDLLGRVFDPFFRVLDQGEAGSGLGLAIVQSVAVRWGGAVTLQNRDDVPSHGLRFTYQQPKDS